MYPKIQNRIFDRGDTYFLFTFIGGFYGTERGSAGQKNAKKIFG